MSPFATAYAAARTKRASSAVETTRGRPNSENGVGRQDEWQAARRPPRRPERPPGGASASASHVIGRDIGVLVYALSERRAGQVLCAARQSGDDVVSSCAASLGHGFAALGCGDAVFDPFSAPCRCRMHTS